MSFLHLGNEIPPAAPAAGKTSLFQQGDRLASIAASGKTAFIGGSAPWNLLRNSGFWFAQRQSPAVNTLYAPGDGARMITADGWGITRLGVTENINYVRQDTEATKQNFLQSRFYGFFNCTLNANRIWVTQIIDAVETDAVRGRYVRLTVKVRTNSVGSVATPVQLGLYAWTGSADGMGANLLTTGFTGTENFDIAPVANWTQVAPARASGLNLTASPTSYTGQSFSSWQTFSGTFLVPTNAVNLCVAVWTGSVQSTANGGLGISDAMLTDSEEFYDYTHLGMADEFLRVARFYQKSFAIDTAPANSAGANTGELHFPAGVAGATAFAGVPVRYPVRMYLPTPTLTLYNPSASNAQVHNVTLGTDCTVSAITADSEAGAWINATAPTSTAAGNNMAVHWSADGEL